MPQQVQVLWYAYNVMVCRWDCKEMVRWLRVNKGLKGFKTFRCFSRVPSEHERFGTPVLAGHIVFQRLFHHMWNVKRFQSWQAACRMSCEKVTRDERWRIPALLRISMIWVYFQVLIFGWQEFLRFWKKYWPLVGSIYSWKPQTLRNLRLWCEIVWPKQFFPLEIGHIVSGKDLASGLAPSCEFFRQVGVSGDHLMRGKAKPLSFGVQIFLKSTVFQQRIQHTFGWEWSYLRDMIWDVSLPFCLVKPPKVDHALVASSCFFVPYSDGKSRHFWHFLQPRLERFCASLEHRFKKPDIAVWPDSWVEHFPNHQHERTLSRPETFQWKHQQLGRFQCPGYELDVLRSHIFQYAHWGVEYIQCQRC